MPRVCWKRGNACHFLSKTDNTVGWNGYVAAKASRAESIGEPVRNLLTMLPHPVAVFIAGCERIARQHDPAIRR